MTTYFLMAGLERPPVDVDLVRRTLASKFVFRYLGIPRRKVGVGSLASHTASGKDKGPSPHNARTQSSPVFSKTFLSGIGALWLEGNRDLTKTLRCLVAGVEVEELST